MLALVILLVLAGVFINWPFTTMKKLLFTCVILLSIFSCKTSENTSIMCECNTSNAQGEHSGMKMALLASRFKSLEELQKIIEIDYEDCSSPEVIKDDRESLVRLKHCSNGIEVTSELKSGLSQGDIIDARDGNFSDRMKLLYDSPYAVANRMALNKVYLLARIKPYLFGEGDAAFYVLAAASVNHINTNDLAYINARDSSEKGYINTFNHITAQAFITSCFSEELADFVADVHELHNMPELTTGRFTTEQIDAPEDNPVDNYVDMINNEWGQELGKVLKQRHDINAKTRWTPDLMVNFLNDIQQYYSWAFQIGFEPFKIEDEVVVRFTKKINVVMQGMPIVSS